MNLGEAWDAQAEAWVRFARDPAGDRTNLLFNLPHFLEFASEPRGRTLDLGCGEGRLGAEPSHFDLVAAFMSLHDMDDLDGAVREAARILRPGGRFCFSVLHPIAGAMMSSSATAIGSSSPSSIGRSRRTHARSSGRDS